MATRNVELSFSSLAGTCLLAASMYVKSWVCRVCHFSQVRWDVSELFQIFEGKLSFFTLNSSSIIPLSLVGLVADLSNFVYNHC